MAKEEEEIFFVNVTGTDELKRDLLESSKTIIEILKNYERFKSANDEKQKEIENLKLKLKEISRLVSKLKSNLPSPKLKIAKKKGKKVKGVKEETKKPRTDLDRLEDELSEIESKLSDLS